MENKIRCDKCKESYMEGYICDFCEEHIPIGFPITVEYGYGSNRVGETKHYCSNRCLELDLDKKEEEIRIAKFLFEDTYKEGTYVDKKGTYAGKEGTYADKKGTYKEEIK